LWGFPRRAPAVFFAASAALVRSAISRRSFSAIRELRDDENFSNLLRAERLDTMPAFLEQRIVDGPAA
jgi:hypothetical protein